MRVALSLNFLILLYTAFAQSYPGPRDHFAATYDSHNEQFLLFGGNGENGEDYLSDLWAYDGEKWMRLDDKTMTPRSSHALVFISFIQKSLLLGGVSKAGEYLDGMGLWNGREWEKLTDGPSPRYSPAIAYDESRKVLVLFSGAGRGDDEMWEYRNGDWIEVEMGDTRPAARVRGQMVYDYSRKTVVLFGGFSEGKSVGDMWEWDGSEWKEITVKTPPARNNHLMVSDIIRKRIVLFGGKNRQDGVLFGDTWEWNGQSWTLISESGPEARDMTAGAFHEAMGKILVFGGRNKDRDKLNDFWSWDGVKWTEISK